MTAYLPGGTMPPTFDGEIDSQGVKVSPKAHEQMHQTLKLAANTGHVAIACMVCGVRSGELGFVDTRAMEKRLKDLAELDAPDDYATPIQPHRRYLYPEFPRDWSSKTFETFTVDDTNRDAYELAQGWAETPAGVLVLYGSTGIGKTHLLAAIAQAIKTACSDVSAWEFDSWVNTLRDVFAADGRDEVRAFQSRMLNVPVLILDEVRAERTSDAIRDMFEAVVNRRTAEGKPILITTNASDADWSAWSQRAYSRLKAAQYATWWPMTGKDRRLIDTPPLGAML